MLLNENFNSETSNYFFFKEACKRICCIKGSGRAAARWEVNEREGAGRSRNAAERRFGFMLMLMFWFYANAPQLSPPPGAKHKRSLSSISARHAANTQLRVPAWKPTTARCREQPPSHSGLGISSRMKSRRKEEETKRGFGILSACRFDSCDGGVVPSWILEKSLLRMRLTSCLVLFILGFYIKTPSDSQTSGMFCAGCRTTWAHFRCANGA